MFRFLGKLIFSCWQCVKEKGPDICWNIVSVLCICISIGLLIHICLFLLIDDCMCETRNSLKNLCVSTSIPKTPTTPTTRTTPTTPTTPKTPITRETKVLLCVSLFIVVCFIVVVCLMLKCITVYNLLKYSEEEFKHQVKLINETYINSTQHHIHQILKRDEELKDLVERHNTDKFIDHVKRVNTEKEYNNQILKQKNDFEIHLQDYKRVVQQDIERQIHQHTEETNVRLDSAKTKNEKILSGWNIEFDMIVQRVKLAQHTAEVAIHKKHEETMKQIHVHYETTKTAMLSDEELINALKSKIKEIAINNEEKLHEFLKSLEKTRVQVGNDALNQLMQLVQDSCRPTGWNRRTTETELVRADRYLAQQVALVARTQDAVTAPVSTDTSVVPAVRSVSTVGAAEAEKLQRNLQAEREKKRKEETRTTGD